MALDNWETIVYTCIFLLPGFIITELIDSIVPPKSFREVKFIFSCIIYSIINLALWIWLDIIIFEKLKTNLVPFYIVLSSSNIVTSIITGTIIGLIKHCELPRKIFRLFKVQMNHPIPTAWDYLFNKKEECFVTVTLKSGKTVSGNFFCNSFASSETTERDLYIEKIYDVDDNENWNEVPRSLGMYISKDEIETIEFFTMEEIENGK